MTQQQRRKTAAAAVESILPRHLEVHVGTEQRGVNRLFYTGVRCFSVGPVNITVCWEGPR